MPHHLSEKDHEEKKRIALEYFNLLIYLINEESFFQYQLIQKLKKEGVEKETFEKNINHALALLSAANESIRKEGPTPFTDYLITSALSYIANYLPAESVRIIINKLEDLNKNIVKPSVSSKQHKAFPQNTREKSFQNLISTVTPILLTSDEHSISPLIKQNNNQIVIDFAADELPYRAYGIRRANRLGASLIQVQPDQFAAVHEQFSISKNTILTLIGHCTKGSNCLSDNAGRMINASQIAQQIYLKMMQTGTPLDTEFTIDLIACQAASSYRDQPSFAEQLVEALSKLGLDNVSVSASPTIMLTTPDGNQANLSRQEDQKASRRAEKECKEKGFFNDLFSSFNSVFSSTAEAKLKVKKEIFRSDHAGKVIRR